MLPCLCFNRHKLVDIFCFIHLLNQTRQILNGFLQCSSPLTSMIITQICPQIRYSSNFQFPCQIKSCRHIFIQFQLFKLRLNIPSAVLRYKTSDLFTIFIDQAYI